MSGLSGAHLQQFMTHKLAPRQHATAGLVRHRLKHLHVTTYASAAEGALSVQCIL
eukprot:m.1323568 g.1323568  ORF g.1323568 m.1323568 type:complete len:55 (+) comp24851_c0_seq7:4854-5018(+)